MRAAAVPHKEQGRARLGPGLCEPWYGVLKADTLDFTQRMPPSAWSDNDEQVLVSMPFWFTASPLPTLVLMTEVPLMGPATAAAAGDTAVPVEKVRGVLVVVYVCCCDAAIVRRRASHDAYPPPPPHLLNTCTSTPVINSQLL